MHRRVPGYAPTPLVEIPELAKQLRVGRVFVKDESARYSLAAFKFLGASWAVFQALAQRTGYVGRLDLDELHAWLSTQEAITLVAATDGNHGRAVARMAQMLGLSARIFVPKVVPAPVIDRITTEGAVVSIVDGDYDAAIAAARRDVDANLDAIIMQDTSWPGYQQIPGWIVEGYLTLFLELDAQLRAAGVQHPQLVAVPVGVGSLAQAAVAHYRNASVVAPPRLLAVEPDTAACVLHSLIDGKLQTVDTADTIMNGLNCATPSELAWPYLRGGLDAAIAVSDNAVRRAIGDLEKFGIASGPSGAASFTGTRGALTGPGSTERRAQLAIDETSVVVCVSTEGPIPSVG